MPRTPNRDAGGLLGGEAVTGLGEFRRLSHFAATLRTRIGNELREHILTGRLAAGASLNLGELAEHFGSSRTPVREALIELAQDGLVQVTPRAGIKVIGVSRRELRDNFLLFAMLSGTAAEWACERMTPERLARIRSLADRVDTAARERRDEIALVNWLFHREINRASESSRLCSLLRGTCRVVPLGFFELVPDQVEITRQEHRDLARAIETGQSRQARQLAEAHVARAGELLMTRLADGEQFGPPPGQRSPRAGLDPTPFPPAHLPGGS